MRRGDSLFHWIGAAELAGVALAASGWWFDSLGLIAFGLTLVLVVTIAFLPLKWLTELDRGRDRKKKQPPPQRRGPPGGH